jgi:hypothetical protein
MIDLILGGIIAILASIFAAMWIENLRKPKLNLTIETPPLDNPQINMRHLRVKLFNKPLSRWAKMDGPGTGLAVPCRDYVPSPRRPQCLWQGNGRALG